MASFKTGLLLFAAVMISAGKPFYFVNLDCETVNLGWIGQQSMLECVVRLSLEATDAKIDYVRWKRGDVALLFYTTSDGTELEPGFRFAEPDWKRSNMNVSLLLKDTKIADEGTYTCTVMTESGEAVHSTNLSVMANYSVPVIRSLTVNDMDPESAMELFCHSSGYPKAEIRWFGDDDTDLTGSSTPAVTKRDDGLFNISSKLTLPPGPTSSVYRCCVYDAEHKRVEATFEVLRLPSKAVGNEQLSGMVSKVVAALVVIGALIVGLLVVLVLKRRPCNHQPVPPSEAEAVDL